MFSKGFTFLVAIVLIGTAWASAAAADDAPQAARPQSLCPMMGTPINKALFVDAEGYRIYVCCPGCLAAVKADPQKAIAKIHAAGETPERIPQTCPACGMVKGSDACQLACLGKGGFKVPANAIGTEVLDVLRTSGVPLVIVDARPNAEQRIAGAKVLPPKPTAEQAAGVIPSKDALVVTYCANLLCPASGMLAARLHQLGYRHVLEYPYGIDGWIAAGNPAVPAAPN